MSGSRAKKIRQEIRSRYDDMGLTPEYLEAEVQKKVDAEFENVIGHIARWLDKRHEERIRSRPRFFPRWLWTRILGYLIAPAPPIPDNPKDIGFWREERARESPFVNPDRERAPL